ncbi:MAG: hypothetical protein ABIB55_01310 [Candidatus Nealsonbacteria bacterium]
MRKNLTTDIYKKIILDSFPRLISWCDKNPSSSSFGCFDRNFWHYKIVDTPSARLQEGVLALTLAYLDIDTPFFQKEDVKEWIAGGLAFWLKIQQKDGSFNEWYPCEKSFVATAFSSCAVSETLLLLPDIKEKEKIIIGLKKAGDWLCSKKDTEVFNQNAGAILVLYNIYLLTGEEKYKKASAELAEFLIQNQSQEGWFKEYGGPDIGYLSLTVDYLAKYYLKSKNEKILTALERTLSFLAYFMHPDGSAGGIYGSRNTSYIIPSGIEILAGFSPLSQKISSFLQESLLNNNILNPAIIDDRYLIQNGYTFLQASHYLKQRGESKNSEAVLPYDIFENKHFPKAGIFIKSTPMLYAVINCKKGGACYIFNRQTKTGIYNTGILLLYKKKSYASSMISEQNELVVSPDSANIVIKGFLKKAPDITPTPFRHFALRAVMASTSFAPGLAGFAKKILRSLLISRKRRSSFIFERSFDFNEGAVIKDSFPAAVFDDGWAGGIQELVLTPSSRYYNNIFKDSLIKRLTKEELLKGLHFTQR